MSLPRIIVALAAALLIAQALVLRAYREVAPGPVLSGILQLGVGLLFVVAAVYAARAPGASRFERRVMLLFAARYVIWSVAQGLATYYEFVGRTDYAGSAAHVLFRIEDVPLGLALILDAGPRDRRDRTHLLDVAQIAVFWTAVYMYITFLTPEGRGLFTSWDALVATSFFLRATLSRSRTANALFGRWTPVLLLSSANHAYSCFYDSIAGAPFDLVWTIDMILWILTALTFRPAGFQVGADGRPAGDPSVRHLPMVVAAFSVVLALGIAQRRPDAAGLLAALTAACLAGRFLWADRKPALTTTDQPRWQ